MKKRSFPKYFIPIIICLIISSISIYAQQGGERRYINLPAKAIQAPFSDGVLVGNTFYLSGRIGFDPKTGKPPDSLENEIHFLFDGIKETLTAGGMTMDDLVYVQVFCPDLSLYNRFNAIYSSCFKKDFPARAFIGSGPLLRGGHFEMQGIAVKQ
jgi:2-iminobutanoate/2-iminopropanoate deaminase